MKFKVSILNFLMLAALSFVPLHIAYSQTASILPPAKTTYLDKNGKPLAFGTVDFYIPGTTTPKTTWQDAGQTIPNTNPVVLDNAGRSIVLGDGSYRQVVRDKNGNVIWDQITSSTGSSGGGGGTPTVGDGDPVGIVKAWSGFVAPSQYVFAYGQEFVRASYPELLSAITSQQNVNCTLGSPTLSGISDTSQLPIGSDIESDCLNSGATIISKTTNTIVASSNAIISTTTSARFFPYGNGNGSSTFKLPDLRGRVIAGANNMGGIASSVLTSPYFGSDPNAIGAIGGNQNHTQTLAELAQHSHSATTTNSASTFNLTFSGNKAVIDTTAFCCSGSAGASVTGTSGVVNNPQVTIPNGGLSLNTTINNQGSSNPFTIIQPTTTFNYIIKVIPDSNPNSFFGVASIGGMYGILNCGVGITCSGNTISALNSAIPTPTPTTLGGLFQSNAPSSQFAVGVDLAGNLIYSGGSTNVNGQVCTIGGSCTITASAGTITVGNTTVAGGSTNAILYNNAGTLGNIITNNNSVLVTNGSGAPLISSTLPSGLIIPSSTINSGNLSGTFTGTPTLSGANFITNANLAQANAATLKGNPTSALSNVQDFTIQGLTNSPSPSPTLDFVPIYDSATNTIKKATPSAIASSVTAGVASIGGLTGIVGVASGITTSGSNVIADPTWQSYVTTSQFGDVGNGTVDDTTAIQNCINYSASTPYVTCILRGSSGGYNHKISAKLTFPTGSSLVGASGNQQLTFTTGINAGGIAIASNYTAGITFSVTISNIIVDVTANTNVDALYMGDASSWKISNITFNLGSNAGMRGLLLQENVSSCSCYNRFYNVTMSQGVTGWEVGNNGNSNTFIGIRSNQSVTGFKATSGNNNAIINAQFENGTTGFTMGAGAANWTLISPRFENWSTGIVTTAGASYLQVTNPYFSVVTTNVNDAANALVNSLYEYRTTVVINSAIPANSVIDTLVNTGVMANCKASAEVTASLNGGTAPAGIIATGMYRIGTGPYLRVANITTSSITPNTDAVLTCRQRQ